MIRVYINGRFLTQKITGIPRFSYEMCRALRCAGLDFVVITPKRIREDLYKCEFNIERIGLFRSHFWEQIDLPVYLRKKGNPILISFSGLGPLFYKKLICTICDVSFFVNPKWFNCIYSRFYSFCTPILVSRSIRIITISNFSKNEIIKYIPTVDGDKIFTIPLAVSQSLSIKTVNLKREQFLLSVCSINPRKNINRLFDVMRKIDNVKLLVVGQNEKTFKKMSYLYPDNVSFLGYVDDARLSELYSLANLFIYPSLYEGFGIPPLEAMQRGCPVIVSDIPVLREVCGDAACYADPNSTDAFVSAIHHIQKNRSYRNQLIENGYRQVSKYNWDSSATKLIAMIAQIL